MSKIVFSDDLNIVCDNIMRHCLMHIAFCKAYDKSDDSVKKNNIAIFIFNSNLNLAVLSFCKIFGSKSEESHWKKFILEQYHQRVIDEVVLKTFKNLDDWESYWQNVTNFRNNYINHLTSEAFIHNVPELAKIKMLVIELFHLISSLTDNYGISGGNVEIFYNSYLDQCYEWLKLRAMSNNE